jgi:hypothetical protein
VCEGKIKERCVMREKTNGTKEIKDEEESGKVKKEKKKNKEEWNIKEIIKRVRILFGIPPKKKKCAVV